MTPVLKRVVLGRPVGRPCFFDPKLVGFALNAITTSPDQRSREIPVMMGKTMGLNDFFEEQGRTDGAIAEHTEEEKMAWLATLSSLGVKNLEMESCEFAAFCYHLHIPAILMCVTLLDRTRGDQISVPPEVLASYSDNLLEAALRVVKQAVHQGTPALSPQIMAPRGA